MLEETYTIIFRRTDGGEAMISQRSNKCVDDVVASWINFLINDKSLSKEESEELLEELDYGENVPVSDLMNVWCHSLLFQDSLYSTYVTQSNTTPTASAVLQKPLSESSRAEGAYVHYRQAYLALKDYNIRDSKTDAARRKAERWMKYWDVKTRFTSCYNTLKQSKVPRGLYTFVFEYGGGTYLSQQWLSDSHLNYMLVVWVEKILKEVAGLKKLKKIIDKEEDRVLLMEHALDERYYPQPISGLVNVWGTYFNLSKGLGNLTIVKTCPETLPLSERGFVTK